MKGLETLKDSGSSKLASHLFIVLESKVLNGPIDRLRDGLKNKNKKF